ncbi:hypothetical protein [Kitasatospora sp. NPDC058046]|uniref:hypothetical protein n=1 Tax=Kitasatospora sp. NPDC058046 TaxID=3346312 RepID=UPI0036DA9387
MPHGGRMLLDSSNVRDETEPIMVWVLESQVSADDARALEIEMQRAVDEALGGPPQPPDGQR